MFKSSASTLLFLLLPIFAASCNVRQVDETATPTPTPFSAAEFKSEVPFSTKEPEIYQTEIIIQTFNAGEKSERKIFAARNGGRRLTVFNDDGKGESSALETGENQVFSIHHGKKIYMESQRAALSTANDFLTVEWLNQKIPAAFENLAAENNLSRFRVRPGDAETVNSEILIYVDENLKIPVRQEFYSVNGEQKILTYSVEMRNFKLEAGEELFEVPKDYRKISLKEFQEILWKERTGNE
jgi:hypothetical protein